MTMEKIFTLMRALEKYCEMQLNNNKGKYTLFIVCKTPYLHDIAYNTINAAMPDYNGVNWIDDNTHLMWDNGDTIILEDWYKAE